MVRARYPPTFTTVLEVTASAEAGSFAPTLVANVPSIFSSGSTFPVVGRGFVSLPIGHEEWSTVYVVRSFDVAIVIPRGMAPLRYQISVR